MQADHPTNASVLTEAHAGDAAPAPEAASVRFSVRYRQRRGDWAVSLNLTPMIDVVFLLLFFFLAATRFQALEGMLPAHLPRRTAAAAAVPRTPIRIRFVTSPALPAECQVTIDQFAEVPQSLDRLVHALEHIRDNEPGFGPGTPVHLLASDDVRWDHVVDAYNAALAARYERVFFAGAQ